MKLFHGIEELVGNTPAMVLERYGKAAGCRAKLVAKLESFNPAGSVKDRVACAMIEDAEERGMLKPGAVLVEPTSGNTGIGLAAIGAAKGYRVILTMPETMSVERRSLLKAYGAELVLTEGAKGMRGAIEKANELAEEISGAFLPGQFDNEANSRAHYRTTGPEIWEAVGGVVDFLVAGIGTGGTITGAGRYLKEQNPAITVVAVEPADSPVLSGGKPGPHKLQGIGAGFIPAILDRTVYDEVMPITSEEAYTAAKELSRREGLLVGISSGAALHAATEVAKLPENAGKTVVVLLPDTGERYLSTPAFA